MLARKAGHDVVVVVSAMAGETNRLLKLTNEIAKRPSQREQDVVVSTGEQVTVGLLALAIQEQKGKSRSFLGHQVRILTDSAFANARIRSIDDAKLRESLKTKEIAVVAGFQGIDEHGNITTLGRGGSDTTAVALAAALKADACEIYTDVDGVYTTDPRVCERARKLQRISYEEMLELASLGSKVLQIRSVEFAMKYKVPLWVKSSFTGDPGTLVCEEDAAMEDVLVSGIALTRDESRFVVRGVPDKPGIAARVFGSLAEQGVVVDVIVQTPAREDGRTDMAFTVGRLDVEKTNELVRRIGKQIGAGKVQQRPPEPEPDSLVPAPPAEPLAQAVVEPVAPVAPEKLAQVASEPVATVESALAGLVLEPERATRARWLMLLGILAAASAAGIVLHQRERARELGEKMRVGREKLLRDDSASLQDAAKLFTEAARATPGRAPLEAERAFALLLEAAAQKDLAERLPTAERDEPERAASRLLQQGAAVARQAFADDKDDPAALRAMALAESISGAADLAAVHAEQAEQAAPGDPWALYAKAAAALAGHAHERAVQALSAAREAEPRLLRADVDLAAISLDRGDPGGAGELLESVLRRNPQHDRARRMLALVSR